MSFSHMYTGSLKHFHTFVFFLRMKAKFAFLGDEKVQGQNIMTQIALTKRHILI